MPSEVSAVGPQTIPVPTGGANSKLRDALCVGIADFAGFLIKQAIDAKLAEMGGPTTSAAITDACPAAHRFPWNHRGNFMRPHPSASASTAPLPGLWVWRSGPMVTDPENSTLVRQAVATDVRLDYIFPQLQTPDGFDGRSGLIAVVIEQLSRYFGIRRTRHPSYGYGSDADGVPLFRSLNCISIDYVRGEATELAMTPTSSAQGSMGRAGNEGHVQRFFPAAQLTLRATMPVDSRAVVEPDDILSDSTVILNVGESVGDTVEFTDAVLIAPRDLP